MSGSSNQMGCTQCMSDLLGALFAPFIEIGGEIQAYNKTQAYVTAHAFFGKTTDPNTSTKLLLESPKKMRGALKAFENSHILPGITLLFASAVGAAVTTTILIAKVAYQALLFSFSFCSQSAKNELSTVNKVVCDENGYTLKALGNHIYNIIKSPFLATPFVGHYLARLCDKVASSVQSLFCSAPDNFSKDALQSPVADDDAPLLMHSKRPTTDDSMIPLVHYDDLTVVSAFNALTQEEIAKAMHPVLYLPEEAPQFMKDCARDLAQKPKEDQLKEAQAHARCHILLRNHYPNKQDRPQWPPEPNHRSSSFEPTKIYQTWLSSLKARFSSCSSSKPVVISTQFGRPAPNASQ